MMQNDSKTNVRRVLWLPVRPGHAPGEDEFRPAGDRGDGESRFLLASLYHAGRGVARDYGRAAALFRRSCADGWARGCGGLAECYRAGPGIASDPALAIEYFEKAAVAGLRRACDFSLRGAEASAAYFRPGSAAQAGGGQEFCSQ